MLEGANLPVPMPDAPDCDVMGVLIDLGIASSGINGATPLSASEIMAWCDGMGTRLTPWEFATVRAMSRSYCAGLQAERAPFEPKAIRLGLATAAAAQNG